MLVQEPDHSDDLPKNFKLVTDTAPSDSQYQDLSLAWNVCKFVKSNATVLAKGGMTWYRCRPNMRVMSLRIAIMKAGDAGVSLKSSCLAGCLFPFRDSVDIAAKAGIEALFSWWFLARQGIIGAANDAGIAMLFT